MPGQSTDAPQSCGAILPTSFLPLLRRFKTIPNHPIQLLKNAANLFPGSFRKSSAQCLEFVSKRSSLVKVYEGQNVRNVAVVGHSHSGKTQLVSALLYAGGAAQRLGRVDDGSAPTNYDDEEITRQMSIASTPAYIEWDKTKINLIDTPGFNMFVHEAKTAMMPSESALVVVDGVSGVEVMTSRVWGYAEELALPRIIVVNRMDRERADANTALESLRNAFGRQVVPVQLPIGSEKNFSGVVDLVTMKAYTYTLGGNGQGKEGPIPAELEEAAKSAHEALVELVAEGKDELMEEFFEKGTIPEDHLITALHEAIREDRIFPVLFASGLGNVGSDHLLDFLVTYAPTAAERAPVPVEMAQAAAASNGSTGAAAEKSVKVADTEPLSLYIFKTISDPFAGHISFFKVFSGTLKTDATVQNFTRSTS